MTSLIQELEQRLQDLDPDTARMVEQLVRDALALAGSHSRGTNSADGRPEGYFQRTAGSLAGEPFDRPDQGEVPPAKEW